MAAISFIRGRWRAQIRRRGQREVSRSFKSKREAVAWARSIEHGADQGERLGGGKARLSALLDAYRGARSDTGRPVRPKSNEDYMLRHLARSLGHVRLDQLDTAALVDFARSRRRAGAGAYTVNMELSKLGTALRYACALAGIRYVDPVAAARPTLHHFGLIGAGKKRERRPSPDEWTALLAAIRALKTDVPLEDIVLVAAVNAFRRGEIVRLRWADIDQESRTIVVRDRKHPREKRDQVVPLIGGTLDVLMRQPRREGEPRIFPFEAGTVSKLFKAAVDAAGIEDLRLHDLRHEAASVLFEAGWSIPEVAAVTGHEDWRHLRRYTQITPAAVAKKGAGSR